MTARSNGHWRGVPAGRPLPPRVRATRDAFGAIAEGTAIAGAVTAELALAGAILARSPWAPINAAASVLLGPRASSPRGWDARVTPLGLGVLTLGLTAWAAVDRFILRRARFRDRSRAVLAAVSLGTASALSLALFDYRLLKPEHRPKLGRWLNSGAIAGKYAVLGAGIAAPTVIQAWRGAAPEGTSP